MHDEEEDLCTKVTKMSVVDACDVCPSVWNNVGLCISDSTVFQTDVNWFMHVFISK